MLWTIMAHLKNLTTTLATESLGGKRAMRKAPGLRLQTAIVQDNIPVEIASGLFVGSIHAAFNVEGLKSKNISHVLNLAGSYAAFPDDFTYLSLSIRDKEYASLLSCLPIAAVFVDAGIKNGGVLVHCAGGRSRSPAVAMAFLIMKQQLPYMSILDHVKTLRPVVSLNAGFEAQLQCLETARGNVFVANQHLLKARLAQLTLQYENGDLRNESGRKRRQTQGPPSQPTSSRLLTNQSSIEMLHFGSDEWGMIGERVPSGFSLSIPLASGGFNETPAKTFDVSFIPALRSMGTMFGCQCCGQSLFCAGAIVHHDAKENPIDNDSIFLKALRGRPTIRLQDNIVENNALVNEACLATVSIPKNPLLAKLRLRPHSPNVLLGNRLRPCADSTALRRKSAPFVQLTTRVELNYRQKAGDKSQIIQPSQQFGLGECKRTISISLSPAKLGQELKKKSGGGIWRSLSLLKSSKRALTLASEDKRINGPSQQRVIMADVRKSAALSTIADVKSIDSGQTPAQFVFLEQNAIEWKRNIQRLVAIDSDSPQRSGGSALDLVTALLHEDSTVLLALHDCHQWVIDPQSWVIGQASFHPEGAIRCPREACEAIVGEWRWEGLKDPCGDNFAPAFMMKKSAVCVLGNMMGQFENPRQ